MVKLSPGWQKFINPQTLRKNLVAASIFITAYEMMRDALVGQLRQFFTNDWRSDETWAPSQEYTEKVLALDKREVVACALWFKNSGALSEEDLALLKKIANHRNEIAHELPALITTDGRDVSIALLRSIHHLTSKIDNWWIRNVEVPTNPDFDDRYPTEKELDEAVSLRMIFMSLLIQVAEGDDSTLESIYREIGERTRKP